jgi:hypothetical protein
MSFTPRDLVWYNEGDSIQSGGYSVDSLFKTLGVSPITTNNMTGGSNKDSNSKIENAKNVSELFKATAVPAGLTMIDGNSKNNTSEYNIQYAGQGLINESLFDKLTKLASPDDVSNKSSKKLRITKKKKSSINKKRNTRRKTK